MEMKKNSRLKLSIKKILLAICISPTISIYANNIEHIPEPTAYIVYDFKNNQVLEQKNINTRRPIASITKLMTANVFLRLNQNPHCVSTITEEDVDLIKNTRTRLPFNTPIDCQSLLQAMLVSSDNYAASALSRSIPNMSKTQFVAEMNRLAREWGMKDTHFVDPSGLSPMNVSTISDLTTLAHHSLFNQTIKNISSITSFSVTNHNNFQRVSFNNTNKLIRERRFIPLISKTGYIRESGYNLLFVNGTPCTNGRYIGVISLNNSSSQNRAAFTAAKLTQYQCNF